MTWENNIFILLFLLIIKFSLSEENSQQAHPLSRARFDIAGTAL